VTFTIDRWRPNASDGAPWARQCVHRTSPVVVTRDASIPSRAVSWSVLRQPSWRASFAVAGQVRHGGRTPCRTAQGITAAARSVTAPLPAHLLGLEVVGRMAPPAAPAVGGAALRPPAGAVAAGAPATGRIRVRRAGRLLEAGCAGPFIRREAHGRPQTRPRGPCPSPAPFFGPALAFGPDMARRGGGGQYLNGGTPRASASPSQITFLPMTATPLPIKRRAAWRRRSTSVASTSRSAGAAASPGR
jgi:hypothetical protein